MQYSNIILSAGTIDQSLMVTGPNISQGMLPVNGKPVISWILDDLIDKDITDITIVINNKDRKLKEFLGRVYRPRTNLTICAVKGKGSIIDSLVEGMNKCDLTNNTRVILGDTLIKDSFNLNHDMVYLGTVDESQRWCLVKLDCDNNLIEYQDKNSEYHDSNQALAGYYEFTDSKHLLNCATECIKDKKHELSDVLQKYSTKHNIKGVITNKWYDFGHIDNLVNARRNLLQPRHFNKLTVNPLLNTITKISTDNSTLKDELNWYLGIPEELKILTPRLIDYKEYEKGVEIVQEYYGYPTLAELYIYGDINIHTWISILKHVLKIHDEFTKYKGTMESSHVYEMYIGKTLNRLKELHNQSSFWSDLLSKDELKINGQCMKNMSSLSNIIIDRIEDYTTTSSISVIHGDLCFSNILFDVTHQIIRLIDPRGSFGIKGIYGDPMYDVAKLRHSVNGMYDFITSGMFRVRSNSNKEFKNEIYHNKTTLEVQIEFDKLLVNSNLNLRDLVLLEGLLFISLVPLHKDNLERQLMLYLKGIETLNKAI